MNFLRRVVMVCFGGCLLILLALLQGRRNDRPPDYFLYSTSSFNQRDSFLYRAAADGSELQLMTDGSAASANFLGWSSDNQWAYLMSYQRIPSIPELYRLHISGCEIQQIDVGERFRDVSLLSPDREWTYYERIDSNSRSIWRSRLDGTQEQKLAGGMVWLRGFSSDGESVLYTVRENQSRQLYRMWLNGTGQEALSDFVEVAVFYPPQAGRWTYFYTFDGQTSTLSRFQPLSDSTQVVMNVPGRAQFRDLALSPDGQWLIFEESSSGLMHLVAAGEQTPGPIRPLELPGRSLSDPQWTPDSKWLLLNIADDEYGTQTVRINPADGTYMLLSAELQWAKVRTISPDSRWAIIDTFDSATKEQSIYRVAIEAARDGYHTTVRLSTPPGDATLFSMDMWSPDGQWYYGMIIRYHNGGELADIFRIHHLTGEFQQVTHEQQLVTFLTWVPGPRHVELAAGRLLVVATLLFGAGLIKRPPLVRRAASRRRPERQQSE